MLEIVWTSSGLHPIFIYIPIKMQMFLTFWKPYVMYPFNFLPLLPQLLLLWRCHLWYLLTLLPQLSLLWRCHLWYLCNQYGYLYHCWHNSYHCWHYRWFHSALAYVLSCSLFIIESKALHSSTLFFFLKALFGESMIAFFLFSNVVYISSLVLLILVGGFNGFSF